MKHPARPMARGASAPVRVAIVSAAAIVAALVTACTTPAKPPPKPPTETEIRARFTAERSYAALAKLEDRFAREAVERQLGDRSRAARGAGRRLAIEDVRLGETMNIGGGQSLQRVFALYHEYDEKAFTTYLEGIELVGGRVRAALREAVGGNGRGFAEIDEVELNRAVLKVYVLEDKDPKCCPSKEARAAYYLTGFGLQSAQ